jgi:hypothetical protein
LWCRPRWTGKKRAQPLELSGGGSSVKAVALVTSQAIAARKLTITLRFIGRINMPYEIEIAAVPRCEMTPERVELLMDVIENMDAHDPAFIAYKEEYLGPENTADWEGLGDYQNILENAVDIYQRECASPAEETKTLYMEGMPFPILCAIMSDSVGIYEPFFDFDHLAQCAPINKLLSLWAMEDHAKQVRAESDGQALTEA